MAEIKRVSVKSGAAGQVCPPNEGESLTGKHELTVQNTSETKDIELATSSAASWGAGFPLAPGEAWSGQVAPGEVIWVIAEDSTVISVALIMVEVP